jgi:hypothetical protein
MVPQPQSSPEQDALATGARAAVATMTRANITNSWIKRFFILFSISSRTGANLYTGWIVKALWHGARQLRPCQLNG